MDTLLIAADGRVTLSNHLLKHLGVRPGDQINVERLSNGRIALRRVRLLGDIADVFGSLKRKGSPSLSVEEINEIAAQGWAGKR
jgi:antitoxin component of MazEF toxin-antitoxin module